MKKITYLTYTIIISISIISCKRNATADKADIKNDIDSISYYTGIFTGHTLKNLNDTTLNADLYYLAVKQVLEQKEFTMNKTETDLIIGSYFEKLRKKQDELNLKQGIEFISNNKSRPGIITMPSGLQYEVITEGSGKKPKMNDKVLVNYRGLFLNGYEFTNTSTSGQPDTLLINGNNTMIGLCEVLPLMKVGSKYKIYLPAELTLDSSQMNVIKPTMTIIFDMELVSIAHD